MDNDSSYQDVSIDEGKQDQLQIRSSFHNVALDLYPIGYF